MALTRRAQVVLEVGIATGVCDGIGYESWYGKASGTTQSPRSGSLLHKVTFAAEWLARLVETPTPGDADALSVIRDDLQDALRRTTQNEPCLRNPP